MVRPSERWCMSTERLTPTEAFEILGDDVRLDILRALNDADGPLSFSELRNRTGVSDSGRFNYHLSRLRNHFLRNTDDGYELGYHGKRVVEAVLGGAFTDTASVEPFSVEGSCYDCDGALEGVYEDERVTISCTVCAERILSVEFPPSALRGRDPETLMAAYDRWSVARVSAAADGICPSCAGVTRRELVEAPEDLPFDVLPAFECTVCTNRSVTSFAALACRSPSVKSFYADHGVDLEARPYWDVEPCVTGEYTTVSSRNPLAVEVVFPAGDEQLRVSLGDDLTVVQTVREFV